jgi:hypothetical protein
MNLICDEPTCDHKEDVGALSEDMIGKPCPKCGANLLTREDYEEGLKYQAVLELLKSAGLAKDPVDGDEGALISVNPHAGTLNISVTGLESDE